jgi:autotransporter-associated beta strand protein
MNLPSPRSSIGLIGLIGLSSSIVCGQLPIVEIRGSDTWLPYAAKTLDSRPDYKVNPANLELSKYGGWKARRHDQGTGFFRVEKINGRWWTIDPEGYLFIHLALNSVNLQYQTSDQIYEMMREHGFNGFGNWTLDGNHVPTDRNVIAESTVKDRIPMAYTPRVLFIGEYRNERLPAGTPRIELPVFDPGFEIRALVYAQEFLPFVNDPHVFGYFSDNELPFRHALRDHLEITNPSDPNYEVAVQFLTARSKTSSNWDQSDADAYMALAGERYYSVVKKAIRSVDTNHMILGSRQHSSEKNNRAFMEIAGQYVDIFSANHYNHWGDRRFETKNMSEWSGRPLMFTEFYVMSSGEGMTAASGAGFHGSNQTARALFYQNFVSTIAESGHVIGFHWFKYNDGLNNVNNTGVINKDGVFYTELLDSMKQVNTQIYDFIDYLDSRPPPDVVLEPEADAYFEGGNNLGTTHELRAKHASSTSFASFRQIYLRFDVSSLQNKIKSAKIVLRSLTSGNQSGFFQAELVEDNTWGETTISSRNAPAGSKLLQTFSDGGSDLEIDVSTVIGTAAAGDGKLSIRIVSTDAFPGIPTYGSREHTDPVARPALMVEYPNTVYWNGADPAGNWGTSGNWSTVSEATMPNPSAVPNAWDDVMFNITSVNADQNLHLGNINQFANSLLFYSTGNTTIARSESEGSEFRSITVGAGGLTLGPDSGNVTISASQRFVELRLADHMSITNHSASSLRFLSNVTAQAGLATKTLMINGSGSGRIEFERAICQESGTTLAVNIHTTGGGIALLCSSSSDFSGGLTLTEGVLAARASDSLGSGSFTINGGTFASLVSNRSFNNSLIINHNFQLGGANVPGSENSTTTFNGPVDLGGSTKTITLASGAAFNGAISNGGLSVEALGKATLTLAGQSDYLGTTRINGGTLRIDGDNSAATGTVNIAADATLGGNGTSGGAVVIAAGGGLDTRITDWTGAAGIGYDDLSVASLNAGSGELKVRVTTTGLTNFTETNRSFTILNSAGGISGFNPAWVGISAPDFQGIGTWALVQEGNSLALQYSAGIADPYLLWADSFDGVDNSKGADPDHDGIKNLMEFVLDGDPVISETNILPTTAANATDFSISYVRREGSKDVNQVIQYSSDLIGWTDVVIPTGAGISNVGVSTVTVGEPAGGTQTVTVKIPCSDSTEVKWFARLVVGP